MYPSGTGAAPPSVSEKSRSLVLVALNWLILVAVVAISLWLIRPPKPVPAGAPGDMFSAERAIEHVRAIARAPHPVGTAANAKVPEYLMGQLSGLGLQPQVQSGVGFAFFYGDLVAANVHNVLGRLRGAANTRAVLLVAHYDSGELTPGAADDGSGVAAILETVRALRAGPPLRNDVMVLFTDGEEPGSLGADLFAASHPWVKDVGVALNFDSGGDAGSSYPLIEPSYGNSWLMREFAAAAPYSLASSALNFGYGATVKAKGSGPVDMSVLANAGIAGLTLGFTENSEVVHMRLDTAANLSQASLQHLGSNALALARRFGGLDLAHASVHSSEDEVFFNWIGTGLVRYPQSWVLPMHAVVTILLVALAVRARRHGKLRAPTMVYAALSCLAVLVLIPALAAAGYWLFNKAYTSRFLWGDTPSHRLLFGAFVTLALAWTTWTIGFLRRRFGLLNLAAGGLALFWILATTAAIAFPATSYLLFWPLLFATATFAWLSSNEESATAPWLATIPALLLYGPFLYLLMIFRAQLPGQFATAAGPGFVIALLSIPLVPFLHGLAPGVTAGRTVSVLLALAALALAALSFTSARFSPRRPQPDTIVYSMNADNRHAVWISYDGSPDSWTEQFLTKHPQRGAPPEYQAGRENVLWNSAPPIDVPAPEVQVLDRSRDKEVLLLHLRLRSPRHANRIALGFGPSTEIFAATIAGRDPFADQVKKMRGPAGPAHTIGFYGVPEEGIDIVLKLKCAGPCKAAVHDTSLGLPEVPGFSFRPRPEDSMGWYGSDVTFVGRQYEF